MVLLFLSRRQLEHVEPESASGKRKSRCNHSHSPAWVGGRSFLCFGQRSGLSSSITQWYYFCSDPSNSLWPCLLLMFCGVTNMQRNIQAQLTTPHCYSSVVFLSLKIKISRRALQDSGWTQECTQCKQALNSVLTIF